MAVTVVESTHVTYEFNPSMTPIAEVEPGSLVEFHTADALGGQIRSEADTLDGLDFSQVNPATGPVAIAGAKPGDALKVEILEIRTASHGVVMAVPGLGLLGDLVKVPQTKIVPIGEEYVDFGSGLVLPKRPMIGVIGVATAQESVPCGTPGDHGGNMDTTDICAGSTLLLPVFQPGAMLAMGDVHALMGDGEICGTGVECPARVLVRVNLLKAAGLARPMVYTKAEVQAIASARTVSEASALAVKDMVAYLQRETDLDFNESYMFLSLSGQMRISQLVDPLLTVRMAVSKDVLSCLQHAAK